MLDNTTTSYDEPLYREDTGRLLNQDFHKEILIIDDEIDFRVSLAELLVSQGYRVSTAWNGDAALDFLFNAERLPDLITIDLKMPVKNGLEFKDELQKMKLFSHIPIILISGFPPPNHFLPKGIKASLSKPLDKLELLEVIETYIQK